MSLQLKNGLWLPSRTSDPGSPTNGDVWMREAALRFQAGGQTLEVQPAHFQQTACEETMPRQEISSNVVACLTQQSRFTYFIARRTETITQIRTATGAAVVGVITSLARVGIHTVDLATGNMTLIASTANDTTLWATANTEYTRSFSSSWSKTAGVLYAMEVLVVSTNATPQFPGQMPVSSVVMNTIFKRPNYLSSQINSGRTDLTSTVSFATLTGSSSRVYAELLP